MFIFGAHLSIRLNNFIVSLVLLPFFFTYTGAPPHIIKEAMDITHTLCSSIGRKERFEEACKELSLDMSLLSIGDANQKDQFLIEQPPLAINEIIEFDDPTLSMLKDPSLLTGMKKKRNFVIG